MRRSSWTGGSNELAACGSPAVMALQDAGDVVCGACGEAPGEAPQGKPARRAHFLFANSGTCSRNLRPGSEPASPGRGRGEEPGARSRAAPADMAHELAATGDGPGRALVVASPSRFARLITEAGTPDEAGGGSFAGQDRDVFLRVAAELGDEILGPSRDRTRPNAAQHA
jgi:hypothetical protein